MRELASNASRIFLSTIYTAEVNTFSSSRISGIIAYLVDTQTFSKRLFMDPKQKPPSHRNKKNVIKKKIMKSNK